MCVWVEPLQLRSSSLFVYELRRVDVADVIIGARGDGPTPAGVHRCRSRIRFDRAVVWHDGGDRPVGFEAVGEWHVGGVERFTQQQRSEAGAVDVGVEYDLLVVGGNQVIDPALGVEYDLIDSGIEVMYAATTREFGEVPDESSIVEVIGVGQVIHQRYVFTIAQVEDRRSIVCHQQGLEGECVDVALAGYRAQHTDRIRTPVERCHEAGGFGPQSNRMPNFHVGATSRYSSSTSISR